MDIESKMQNICTGKSIRSALKTAVAFALAMTALIVSKADAGIDPLQYVPLSITPASGIANTQPAWGVIRGCDTLDGHTIYTLWESGIISEMNPANMSVIRTFSSGIGATTGFCTVAPEYLNLGLAEKAFSSFFYGIGQIRRQPEVN
jgi:hypothetical protein